MAGPPFDFPHVLFQWGGSLPGGEQWVNSMRMMNTAAPGGDPPLETIDLTPYKDAIVGFHEIGISDSAAKLNFVKGNGIDILGHYIYPTTNELVFPDVPGAGTNSLPNQVSLVVTWTTAVSRGPAHEGRMYLPLPYFQVQADGRISAANATFAAGAAFNFVTAMNAIFAGDNCVVMSRKLGHPAHQQITGAKVGRVYDTQRRRRRSLLEDYQAS